MWPAPVVVRDPLFEKAPQVPLVERNQKIQAFAAHCTYCSLTESVRLGSLKRCLQYPQIHRLQSKIELGRVDAVPIVECKPVGLVTSDHFAELLERPGCRGIRSDIAVSNPAGSHFHDHKDVQDSKRSSHHNKENRKREWREHGFARTSSSA